MLFFLPRCSVKTVLYSTCINIHINVHYYNRRLYLPDHMKHYFLFFFFNIKMSQLHIVNIMLLWMHFHGDIDTLAYSLKASSVLNMEIWKTLCFSPFSFLFHLFACPSNLPACSRAVLVWPTIINAKIYVFK